MVQLNYHPLYAYTRRFISHHHKVLLNSLMMLFYASLASFSFSEGDIGHFSNMALLNGLIVDDSNHKMPFSLPLLSAQASLYLCSHLCLFLSTYLPSGFTKRDEKNESIEMMMFCGLVYLPEICHFYILVNKNWPNYALYATLGSLNSSVQWFFYWSSTMCAIKK